MGGIINASGALSDIDKPPETQALQPNVPEIVPMVFELMSGEKKGVSVYHLFYPADEN